MDDDPNANSEPGYPPHGVDPSEPPRPRQIPNGQCIRCGGEIATSGRWDFRYGGMDGGLLKFLVGDWGEFGEGRLGMDVWICRLCGHVEFRLPRADDPPE